MTTDLPALCERAEQLWHQIAPLDLAGAPAYILPLSALPNHFGTADDCHAYTTPSLDLYLQPALGPAYRGRGPAAVVNDATLAADWPPAEDFELAFLLAALHELGHVMQRDQLYRDRLDASPERLHFETLLLAQTAAEPEPADPQLPPFASHGAAFIRTAIHVSYRANRLGVPVKPSGLCAGSRYRLWPACLYAEVLGDEPARLRHESFRTIRETPYPKEFSQLWTADVAAWLDQHVSSKEEEQR